MRSVSYLFNCETGEKVAANFFENRLKDGGYAQTGMSVLLADGQDVCAPERQSGMSVLLRDGQDVRPPTGH